MAQTFKAQAAFPKDLGSIISTHIVTHVCNFGPTVLLASKGIRHVSGVKTYMQAKQHSINITRKNPF